MRMRRKIVIFMLALLLVLSVGVQVSASEYGFVWDEADILTDEEERLLETAAEDISDRFGCGVYIVTLWDYWEYGYDALDAAQTYFLNNGFGLGNDGNGVMLMLSMAQRDYALIAHGNLANRAFTDYGKDLLSEEFLDDFRYDEWFGGFEDYISCSGDFLQASSEGTPVDIGYRSESDTAALSLIMVLLIPGVIAGVSCGVMAASMKTARISRNADEYILRRGIQITGRHDRFINRTVVRQKIETESHSGGTRVNSGGFSGKSGKF